MNRRQLVALGAGSFGSIMAGCIDTDSTVESESGERNSTDAEPTDARAETGGTADTPDRCLDDVHAVIVGETDVPDGVTVVDLSAMQFDQRSTVRRAIEDAADAANDNGGVNVCREEYEELHERFEQLSERGDAEQEQRQRGTIYVDHEGTVAKVVLEANDS